MQSINWTQKLVKFAATGGLSYIGLKYIAGINDGPTALGPVAVSNDLGIAACFGAASMFSETMKDMLLARFPANWATNNAVISLAQPVITGAVGVGANALLNQDFDYGFDIDMAKIFGVGAASEVASHYVTDIATGFGGSGSSTNTAMTM